MREFKHLTADQRYQICALRKERKSYAFIANQIGVAKSTVSREIQNNSGQRGYRPKQAQEFADARKANASQVGRNTKKFAPQDRQLVEKMIRLDLSPQQISGRLRLEGRLNISHETLYKWIYADKKRGGDLHGHDARRYGLLLGLDALMGRPDNIRVMLARLPAEAIADAIPRTLGLAAIGHKPERAMEIIALLTPLSINLDTPAPWGMGPRQSSATVRGDDAWLTQGIAAFDEARKLRADIAGPMSSPSKPHRPSL